MEFVMSLRDLDREDRAIAGGEGANLGELVRAGLQVPDGFVGDFGRLREGGQSARSQDRRPGSRW